MRAALLLAVLLLLPAAAASGERGAFTLGPGQSTMLRLTLAKPAAVGLALRMDVGAARELAVDGPGACDMATTAAAVGNGAYMAMTRCSLPAGTHVFKVRLGAGVAKGWVEASEGRWA